MLINQTAATLYNSINMARSNTHWSLLHVFKESKRFATQTGLEPKSTKNS